MAFHRGDMGSLQGHHRESIADCFACGESLASGLVDSIEPYVPEVMNWLSGVAASVMSSIPSATNSDILKVMRQLALLFLSRYSTVKLHDHVCGQLGLQPVALTYGKHGFESRLLAERHHVIQLIGWLMMDLESRLRSAWRAKAVRYNHMLKDFDGAPQFYLEIVEGFANWREA